MKLDKYRGIIPAFYACYDRVGEVSEDGVRTLTRYLMDQGVKGAYVGGSSGEYIYQSMEDRRRTLEAMMGESADCLTIITHATCNDTGDGHILAAHAQDLGMDGITAIPPIHFKLPEHSVAGYWNDISETASGTDFTIYNIPQLAGTALTMNLLKAVLLDSRVAGVKNSSMPIQDIRMFKAEAMKTRQDFIVFNGPDGQLMSGLAIRVDRGIGGAYGAMPELFLKIYELVSENRITETRTIQYGADEIIYKLCPGACNMYATIEKMLHIDREINIGGIRKLLTDLYGSGRVIARKAAAMMEDARERYC